jgi:hypothetical protein
MKQLIFQILFIEMTIELLISDCLSNDKSIFIYLSIFDITINILNLK